MTASDTITLSTKLLIHEPLGGTLKPYRNHTRGGMQEEEQCVV
jgi:hypothetical protein